MTPAVPDFLFRTAVNARGYSTTLW